MVPVIPCLSVVLNVYLMMELEYKTWVRFILWLVFGEYIRILSSCTLLINNFVGVGEAAIESFFSEDFRFWFFFFCPLCFFSSMYRNRHDTP